MKQSPHVQVSLSVATDGRPPASMFWIQHLWQQHLIHNMYRYNTVVSYIYISHKLVSAGTGNDVMSAAMQLGHVWQAAAPKQTSTAPPHLQKKSKSLYVKLG